MGCLLFLYYGCLAGLLDQSFKLIEAVGVHAFQVFFKIAFGPVAGGNDLTWRHTMQTIKENVVTLSPFKSEVLGHVRPGIFIFGRLRHVTKDIGAGTQCVTSGGGLQAIRDFHFWHHSVGRVGS